METSILYASDLPVYMIEMIGSTNYCKYYLFQKYEQTADFFLFTLSLSCS